VSAYACSPYRGSEPGVGWNWVVMLSKYHDLWVITEKDEFQSDLEKEMSRTPELNQRIKFYYVKRKRNIILEKIWPPSYYWTYKKWQKDAYALACSLHKEIDFDAVHQLNMIGYREPGYLWKLPLPFIWGPIGGFVQTPWPFIRFIGLRNALHYSARNIINSLQMRFSQRVRAAMNKANALIAATKVDQKGIEKHFGKKSLLISEIGISEPLHIPKDKGFDSKRIIELCWCGRIIGGKALPIALYALNKIKNEIQIKLHVIGDGHDRRQCVMLAQKLGLDSIIHWHDWMEHDESIRLISKSDAMLITSIQDSTSNVVMEALSHGVPVICHDLCGFGNVIDETCGIKITAVNPQKSIDGFANAIRNLANNPALLTNLSNGALARASEFTWDHKMKALASIYNEVIPNSASL
jgi:glycosyltransferase involved in cell wall biosynthesis